MSYELAQWRWTEPSAWRVTLGSGSGVEIWADGFQKQDGYVVFTALLDANRPPEASTLVVGRTPSDPLRLDVAIARFPLADVSDVSSV